MLNQAVNITLCGGWLGSNSRRTHRAEVSMYCLHETNRLGKLKMHSRHVPVRKNVQGDADLLCGGGPQRRTHSSVKAKRASLPERKETPFGHAKLKTKLR